VEAVRGFLRPVISNESYNFKAKPPCYTSSKEYKTNLEGVEAGKGRNGSWDVVFGNERHDGNHGKTTIVKFTILLGGKGGRRNAREINRREDNGWKWTSLGVMNILGLGDKLGNEDGSQNLGLTGVRDGFPGIEWLHGGEALE